MTGRGAASHRGTRQLNEAIGVRARVLPMCDEPLRTWVRTDAGWRDFQQFMIRDRAAGQVHEVAFATTPQARLAPVGSTPATEPRAATRQTPAAQPTPEVLAALADARAVIVGPSNPVISIWPILTCWTTRSRSSRRRSCASAQSSAARSSRVPPPRSCSVRAAGQRRRCGRLLRGSQPGLLDGIVADEIVAGICRRCNSTRCMSDAATHAHESRRARWSSRKRFSSARSAAQPLRALLWRLCLDAFELWCLRFSCLLSV